MEITCDYCKKVFSLIPVDIKTIKITLDEEDYLLKYFMCPDCGSIYKVLLLTVSDIQLQYAVIQLKEKYMDALKQKNSVLSQTYYQEYLKKKKAFEVVVQRTNKKYPGTFMFDKENNQIVYREKITRKKRRM